MPNASQILNKKTQYNVHLKWGLAISGITKEDFDKLMEAKTKMNEAVLTIKNRVRGNNSYLDSQFTFHTNDVGLLEVQEETAHPIQLANSGVGK